LYAISTGISPVGGGISSGGGIVDCGANVVVNATPSACYQFINWTENGTEVSAASSYAFTATGNRALVANFQQVDFSTYEISVGPSPATGGITSGSSTAGCGSNLTVTATPNPPYQFLNWIENGTVVSTNTSYAFTVTTNRNLVALFDRAPVITVSPAITNAFLIISNRAVVVAGETNVFNVGAMDPDGDALAYQWLFGDGGTNAWLPTSIATYAYATNNCGPYTASVAVSDGQLTTRSNLAVVAACDLTITKLLVTLNFTKTNADSIAMTGKLHLPGVTNVLQLASTAVVVDIADVQVPFTLDKKGRGVNSNGTCRLTYTKATKKIPAYWTATFALSKGTWRVPLAAYGLTNTLVKAPGKPVTLPVVVLVGNEAFAAEKTLKYTATLKTGMAK
jgi:hypothetical protein